MRKALSLFIKAAVSGVLLYFTLVAVNIGAVKDRLANIDASWIALGLLALLLQVFMQATRWRKIVIRCGAALALAKAFRFNMIATFFNQTLPSSVGGDAVAAFAYAGLPQSDGLIVSLLYGAGFLIIGLVGGLVWILFADRPDHKIVPVAANGGEQ
jgi:uncharacterized membrane protein YbhN (UPF0104 family)